MLEFGNGSVELLQSCLAFLLLRDDHWRIQGLGIFLPAAGLVFLLRSIGIACRNHQNVRSENNQHNEYVQQGS